MSEEKPFLTGRSYIFKINKGDDLLAALEDFCHDNMIKCAIVSGIGSFQNAVYGFFDQKKRKYEKHALDEKVEILSLQGNVSILDDRPMVHAHLVMSDEKGQFYGGHMMAGCKVFSAEVFIQELVGSPRVRKMDKATGLQLWLNTR